MKITLFHIIYLVYVFVMACVGFAIGVEYGWGVGAIGFVVGFGFGIGSLIAANLAIGVWYKLRPLRPKCSSGICSSNEYSWIGEDSIGDWFRCQCGVNYLRTRKRFYIQHEDGTLHRYMKRRVLFGWESDDDSHMEK